MKYWQKQAWKTFEAQQKNTTGPARRGSQRGGTRSAMGENVMMQYIENGDRTPIAGTLAADMREFACSLWCGFHGRSAAPETWGNATKAIREEFYYEMESKFYVLCLCDNHWKSQTIAMTIYSQWHGNFVKKHEAVKEEDNSDDEPAMKRLKVAKTDSSPEPMLSHGSVTVTPKVITPIDPLY
jgi:hypothetical protein